MSDVSVVEGEPAVIWPGLERVEQAVGTSHPAGGHRPGAVEVEVVDR